MAYSSVFRSASARRSKTQGLSSGSSRPLRRGSRRRAGPVGRPPSILRAKPCPDRDRRSRAPAAGLRPVPQSSGSASGRSPRGFIRRRDAVCSPPFGSRLRLNKHFAPNLHALGCLTIPHKIVKGCPANSMCGAKFRNRERHLVFHGQPCTIIAAYCQQVARFRASGGFIRQFWQTNP